MKKYLFVSSLALMAFLISCKSDATTTEETTTETTVTEPITTNETALSTTVVTDLTSMSVDRMEHDFGKIPDLAPVETKFVITNTGDKPLLISNAQGSCGCTVPEYPKEPIAPGESRDMKVSFNPSGKEGAQTKTVTITANTPEGTTVLNIKSEVVKSAQ
ncbi:MAG: DUF1573 domain-containing protein [Chitinophagales bacterium]